MLSNFMTDKISLLKKDGTKIEGIKANVQKDNIFIDNADILIESGDLILRLMSNGGEETFKVIDPGFYEKNHGVPAHYQVDVKKLGLPEAENAIQTITYNINGDNARVNQNSIDSSVNTIIINPQVIKSLDAMRAEIDSLPDGDKLKNEVNDIVDAIQEQFTSREPNKTIVSALLDKLPSIGSISSLGSFILSCITKTT